MIRPPLPNVLFTWPSFRRWLGLCFLLWGARHGSAWALSRPLGRILPDESGDALLLEVLRIRAGEVIGALRASALLLPSVWFFLICATIALITLLVPQRKTGKATRPVSPERSHAQAENFLRALILTLFASGLGLGLLSVGAYLLWKIGSIPVALGGGGACLALLGLGGIWLDLTRAYLMSFGGTLSLALRESLRSFARSFPILAAARLAVLLASLGIVWAAARSVDAISPDVSITSPWIPWIHRAAGWLLAAVQVTWLSFVVRSTWLNSQLKRARRASDDRSARSDAPVGPTPDPDAPHVG